MNEIEKMDWQTFSDYVEIILQQIKRDKVEFEAVVSIPRGGLVLGTCLSHALDIPIIIWEDGMTDTLDKERLKEGNFLIVDDIVDSGITLCGILEYFNIRKLKIATLYYKPISKIKPDYYAGDTVNWIVFPWELKKEETNNDMSEMW